MNSAVPVLGATSDLALNALGATELRLRRLPTCDAVEIVRPRRGISVAARSLWDGAGYMADGIAPGDVAQAVATIAARLTANLPATVSANASPGQVCRQSFQFEAHGRTFSSVRAPDGAWEMHDGANDDEGKSPFAILSADLTLRDVATIAARVARWLSPDGRDALSLWGGLLPDAEPDDPAIQILSIDPLWSGRMDTAIARVLDHALTDLTARTEKHLMPVVRAGVSAVWAATLQERCGSLGPRAPIGVFGLLETDGNGPLLRRRFERAWATGRAMGALTHLPATDDTRRALPALLAAGVCTAWRRPARTADPTPISEVNNIIQGRPSFASALLAELERAGLNARPLERALAAFEPDAAPPSRVIKPAPSGLLH